jgi:hypothetical protein
MQEEKARISENTHAKVSADLDTKRATAKATQKEYLDKMVAHTASGKHSLDLDMKLGEKKVDLDGREWDMNLREAVLAEVQTRRLNH